jgi:hypothetical protein
MSTNDDHGTTPAQKGAYLPLGGAQRRKLMPYELLAYLEDGEDSWLYEMEASYAGMDAPLLLERHETTFVDYLRVSCAGLASRAGSACWRVLSATLPRC